MKTVHFLAIKQDGIIDYLLTPLRINRKALRERGYDIRFFYDPDPSCQACDILCLLSKAVMPMLRDRNTFLSPDGPVVRFIEQARKQTDKIIWFDTSDSTSVTHFELLPYIDLYLKKQIFKDKSLYRKDFYGGRIFSDFYHHQFQIEDPEAFDQFYPLDTDQEHKVDLSWNLGLGDLANSGTRKSFYRRYVPDLIPVRLNPSLMPTTDKNLDVFLSTSANLKRPTVAFHRQELVKRLREIREKNGLSGAINGPRLPEKAFREKLATTKIMPSPFGWGEIGLRDYEAFIYGSALLKPDVSHMATWPDIFISHQTYVPFDWDFENLESTILALLNNDTQREDIARQGQQTYQSSISEQGMALFCDWFIQQIEKTALPHIPNA